MKPIYTLLVLPLFISLQACQEETAFEEIELTLDTQPFYEIRLETSSNVRVFHSNNYRVVLRGQEYAVYDVLVNVYHEKLTIEETYHSDLDIEIYVPDLSAITCVGSSLVYGEDVFHSHNFWISYVGSGEIDFAVEAENLFVTQIGSAYIYLEGNVETLDASLGGSGWLRTFNLETENADVHIGASGSAEVVANSHLDAFIEGSGDVFYKGHPIINALITGSGSVIDAN